MERIQIDTARLGGTGGTIKTMVEQMQGCVQRLYAEMAELDTMWQGPANAAFEAQFRQDQQAMEQICQALQGYAEDLEQAKSEYEKCNGDVRGIIDAIRV
ncbi:WXG100 family type VII secretion target [uncultured Subdoligranulum sp.]|uniref:WXG100 family type VII secretion target n=1 Tax=uncultured Subdoligranulum sp. TaxID=512298 RepID=UPI0026221A88|nr:WXG100 family type VII secretion target [uncultured Subdoligranulum sp.]